MEGKTGKITMADKKHMEGKKHMEDKIQMINKKEIDLIDLIGLIINKIDLEGSLKAINM